jgi:hypothetical protein
LALVESSKLVVGQDNYLNCTSYRNPSCDLVNCCLFWQLHENCLLYLSINLYRIIIVVMFGVPRKGVLEKLFETITNFLVLTRFSNKIELVKLRVNDYNWNWNLTINKLNLYSFRQLLVSFSYTPFFRIAILLNLIRNCICLQLTFLFYLLLLLH